MIKNSNNTSIFREDPEFCHDCIAKIVEASKVSDPNTAKYFSDGTIRVAVKELVHASAPVDETKIKDLLRVPMDAAK